MTGFFVAWDDSSIDSLRRNVAGLDTVVPEYWHRAPGRQFQPESPAKNAAILVFVALWRHSLKLTLMVNNCGPRPRAGPRRCTEQASN